jgi:hypothetical protein
MYYMARAARFYGASLQRQTWYKASPIDYPWLYKDSTPKITLQNKHRVLRVGVRSPERGAMCVRLPGHRPRWRTATSTA